MEAVRIEGPLRRRSQPEVVIHARRHGPVGRIARVLHPVQVRPHSHLAHLPQPPRMHELDRLAVVVPAAPHRAHLHHAPVSVGRRHHRPPLRDARRQRLLAIHVLARLARHHGRQRVPVVGRAHQARVDVLALQNAPEIFHRLRFRPVLFLKTRQRRRDLRVVHVAHHGDLHLGMRAERSRVGDRNPAAPDQSHPHPVVRSHNPALRCRDRRRSRDK